MNNYNQLQVQYISEFKKIVPILDLLKANWDQYREYLGWCDLCSPIIMSPQILFIGINPGPGRYREWNYGKIETEHQIPRDFPTTWRSDIEWFKPNNARRDSQWWDCNAKMKNFLPYYMCKLLCQVFKEECSSLVDDEMTAYFNQNIMVTNICPLATDNLDSLKTLYRKLSRNLRGCDAESIFIAHTIALIELVQPKSIVFLGKSSADILASDIRHIPSITIERKHGWHSHKNLQSLAEQIRDLITRQTSK